MSESTIRPLQIFISYAHSDEEAVRKFYRYLRRKGFIVWLDKENLLPGQDWEYEIEKALSESDVAIVCLSTNSVEKESYIQKEYKFASEKALEMPEGRIFLIPVRLDICNVPRKFSRYQYVDLFSEDWHKKITQALEIRINQLGLKKPAQVKRVKKHTSIKSSSQKLLSVRAFPKTKSQPHEDNLTDPIQISQTRYLDCLDSARFSSKVSYQNIRLLRLLYVKAQFFLAFISGDKIIATENQILDSMGFLETLDEVLRYAKRTKIEDLPIQVALRPSNADLYQSVAKNLENKSYTLSLWEDLNTNIERRKKWASAIMVRRKPSGKKVVFSTEKVMLNKLWRMLEYFNLYRCINAKDVPEEFANRLEQIVSFDDDTIENMKSQNFDDKAFILRQGIFTSGIEANAAKVIVKTLSAIRNRVNKRITSRSIIRDAVKELDYNQDIKDGIYELVDGIYNQVLGIASSASIIQSSSFQEQTQPYIKAGYSLAAFIQETNNSHFHNMYVPWEVFEYDGLEGADKVDGEALEAINKSVPWGKLLRLSRNKSWAKSLAEYKNILFSLQKTDELLTTEENKNSEKYKKYEVEHNTKQFELGKAWGRHIDNSRRLIGSSYWGITDSQIFFVSSKEKRNKERLPFFISYSYFKTKRDLSKDEMYVKWQRNLSIKGRMDARSISASIE